MLKIIKNVSHPLYKCECQKKSGNKWVKRIEATQLLETISHPLELDRRDTRNKNFPGRLLRQYKAISQKPLFGGPMTKMCEKIPNVLPQTRHRDRD